MEDFSMERYLRIHGYLEISNLKVLIRIATIVTVAFMVITVITIGELAEMAARSYSRRIKWN